MYSIIPKVGLIRKPRHPKYYTHKRQTSLCRSGWKNRRRYRTLSFFRWSGQTSFQKGNKVRNRNGPVHRRGPCAGLGDTISSFQGSFSRCALKSRSCLENLSATNAPQKSPSSSYRNSSRNSYTARWSKAPYANESDRSRSSCNSWNSRYPFRGFRWSNSIISYGAYRMRSG